MNNNFYPPHPGNFNPPQPQFGQKVKSTIHPNVPFSATDFARDYRITMFGPIPPNHVPTAHPLSHHTLQQIPQIFDRNDTDRDGLIKVIDLGRPIGQVFALEGKGAPQASDTAYFLAKYHFNDEAGLGIREFRRLIKELAGHKQYDRHNIHRISSKPKGPGVFPPQPGNFGNVAPPNAFPPQMGNIAPPPNPGNFGHGQPPFIPPPNPGNFGHGQPPFIPPPNMGYPPMPGNPYAPQFTPQANQMTPQLSKQYHLSPYAVQNSLQAFSRYDKAHKDQIPFSDLVPAINEVFQMDNQPPPNPSDIQACMQKFNLIGHQQATRVEFSKVLFSLIGYPTP